MFLSFVLRLVSKYKILIYYQNQEVQGTILHFILPDGKPVHRILLCHSLVWFFFNNCRFDFVS